MGVEITFFGDNDNVLAQVCTDGDIENTYTGSTANAVEEAYVNAGVEKDYFGNRLNEIERLADQASGEEADLYALDATEEEVAEFGALPMTLSDGGVTATHVLAGGLGAETDYGAFPAGFTTGASKVFTAEAGDIVGFEWAISGPEITEGDLEVEGVYVNTWNAKIVVMSETASLFYIIVGSRNGDSVDVRGGNFILVHRNGTGGVYQAENMDSVPERIGIDLDKVTNKLRLTVDGEPVTLSADGISGSNFFTGIIVQEGIAMDEAYVGESVSATVIDQAADMTAPHTAGAVDRHGEEI